MLRFVIFNVNDHKNSFKLILSPLSTVILIISICVVLSHSKFIIKKEKLPFEIRVDGNDVRTSHTASLEMGKQFNYLLRRFLQKIRLLIIICLRWTHEN